MDTGVTIGFSLGSNVGDKQQAVHQALELLDAHHQVILTERSMLYRTAPWGVTDQDWFVNACAVGTTTLGAYDLLKVCKEIEATLGRENAKRWGPRRIDVDILFYGEEQIDEPDLIIPHAQIMARAFVLKPLFEIVPKIKIGDVPLKDALEAVSKDAAGVVPIFSK